MFELKRDHGHHKVFKFDSKIRPFLEKILGTEDLEHLHQAHPEYNGTYAVDTVLHKKFYNEIKTNPEFGNIYYGILREIYDNFFQEEDCIIFQTFPSIRFQFQNSIALKKHYDADESGNHPLGECNFIVPITKMTGTARLFVESEPGKEDFEGWDLEYGDLFYFNGNTCSHYSCPNQEDYVRISLDFRVIRPKDYIPYIMNNDIVMTRPKDPNSNVVPVPITIGSYYQIMFKNDTCYESYKRTSKIVQSRPKFSNVEADAVYSYMTTGDPFLMEFKQTRALERMISDMMGVKHCTMVPSGTLALVCALLACGITKDDEVIVPAYTMVATVNAVKLIGACPVIIDVSRETQTITRLDVERAIGPLTKAVIHVSINNRDSDLIEISQLCREKSIYLIEDAAQSVGCAPYGTVGDIGCFSLSTPKIISTGQGGFITTNNDVLAKKVEMVKNFGREQGNNDDYSSFGINAKFTDLQAVIGIEQFKQLPERIARYKEIAHEYNRHIPSIHFDKFPWFIEFMSNDRKGLVRFLAQHGVETRPCYPALSNAPNAKFISEHGLFLPTHMDLSNFDIKFICKLVNCYERWFLLSTN